MSIWQRWFIVLCALITGQTAYAETDCGSIKMWTRRPGDYRDGNDIQPMHEKILDMGKLPVKKHTAFDSQYGKKNRYQAVSLFTLIGDDSASSDNDLLLLHFHNKMIIPIFRNDRMAANAILIATAIEVDGKWTSEFPLVERDDPVYRDPRPIKFCGNKIIVSDPKGIKIAEQATSPKSFTPWRHIDSLTGVELANSSAYYRQFDVSTTPQGSEGFQVYKNRCQFCHGAQQVGAGLGWDYAGPIAAYAKRPPESLLLHVKYEKAQKFGLGIIMPSQPDITESEAKRLWIWLRDVATKKLKPYSP